MAIHLFHISNSSISKEHGISAFIVFLFFLSNGTLICAFIICVYKTVNYSLFKEFTGSLDSVQVMQNHQ